MDFPADTRAAADKISFLNKAFLEAARVDDCGAEPGVAEPARSRLDDEIHNQPRKKTGHNAVLAGSFNSLSITKLGMRKLTK